MKSGNILTIMKKEFARFFGDRRMVLSTLILPGVLIYVLYSFMGSAITNMFTVEDDYTAVVAVVNLPDSIAVMAEDSGLAFREIGKDELEQCQAQVAEQELDLCAAFPADFDAAAAAYETASGQPAPNVEVWYNSASTESADTYQLMIGLLDAYESALANRFDVNRAGEGYDLASQRDTAGMMFSSMLPLLLMIFLFSGCMAVAPESIAGEKERGTIATLLVTPMRRSELAIGKIASLAVIALLSGVSSAAGTLLSLPKLMGMAAEDMSAAVYTFLDYVLLGVVILSTVLVLVTLISILSTFAKTVKEAQTLVVPLMIVVMLLGVTAMFGGGPRTSPVSYLIPLYNSVQCISGIFSFRMIPANILVTVAANLVYTGLGVFVLTRMFNREKIVFSR